MQVDSYDLIASRLHKFGTPFRFFFLIDAPNAVTVRFYKNGSPTREIANNVQSGYISEPGNWDDPDDAFDGFSIQSATTQTVVIGLSDRRGDYRFALSLVQVQQPNGMSSTVDYPVTAAAAVAVAANTARRKLIVVNVGANPCRVGDSAITAARGARLVAGASITLDNTAALYAIHEGAATTLAILEETRT